MTSAERARALKKSLGRDGKKLSRICGSVGIEKRRNPGLISGAQRRKFNSHHFAPGQSLLERGQCRRAIRGIVFEVKLVGKLMQDDVFAIGGISCAGFGCIPREYFFFNHAATLDFYTLSLHDALPI